MDQDGHVGVSVHAYQFVFQVKKEGVHQTRLNARARENTATEKEKIKLYHEREIKSNCNK